jgi:hypothetical protein
VLQAKRFFTAVSAFEREICLQFAATRLKFAARLVASNQFGRRLADYPA